MGFHYGPVNITKPSGWWYTYPSEKYEFVSWDVIPLPIWWEKNKACSKPPTSHVHPLRKSIRNRWQLLCHHQDTVAATANRPLAPWWIWNQYSSGWMLRFPRNDGRSWFQYGYGWSSLVPWWTTGRGSSTNNILGLQLLTHPHKWSKPNWMSVQLCFCVDLQHFLQVFPSGWYASFLCFTRLGTCFYWTGSCSVMYVYVYVHVYVYIDFCMSSRSPISSCSNPCLSVTNSFRVAKLHEQMLQRSSIAPLVFLFITQ